MSKPFTDPRDEEICEYTGLNRLLKSKFVQILCNKLDDGTFREFFADWKWIFSYSEKYRWVIAVYTIMGMLSTTLGLVSSVASKYLIDIITGYQFDKLWLLALIMVFSLLSSLVFSSVVSRISAKISIYVNNDIQAEIFDRIMDCDWKSVSGYASGDLLNRFNSDVSTVANNAVNWLPNLLIALYQFTATLAVILYYDVTMALIALVSAPFLLLSSRLLMRKMRDYRKKMLEVNSSLMAFETETFCNFDTIKSFGIMGLYSKRLRAWQENYKEASLDYNWFTIQSNVWVSLLSALVSLLAFGYCLFRLWTGNITYGTMMLFLEQRNKLSGSMQSMVSIAPNMLNSAVSARRIRELVELPPEQHDAETAEQMRAQAEHGFCVEMQAVRFSYDGERDVLQESDFLAQPGEIVALVGPSGEGKTTMLRMILGLIHPEKGRVSLRCLDGTKAEVNADVREFFSYVPQGNTVFSGTIADNLRMVREDATEEQMVQALRAACVWDFVEKLTGGLYGTLGERGHGISEGQAQRIAIARAILRDAPILLLDEATSALDVRTEREVLRNIVRQYPNKTCIVTTHRPSVLTLCQRVYRVMDAKVTELSKQQAAQMVQDF